MKNFLKLITVILIVSALLFVFSGCSKKASGNSSKNSSNKTNTSSQQKEQKPNEISTTKSDDSSNGELVKSGLLLGLRNDDTNTYRTLWISPDGQEIKVKAENNFILVPYKDNFWKLEFKNIEYNESPYKDTNTSKKIKISRLSSHYASKNFKWDLFNDAGFKDCAEYSDINKLLFVGNKYVCLEKKSYENNGEISKYSSENVGIYKIDSLSNSSKLDNTDLKPNNASKVSLKSIFGDKIEDSVAKCAAQQVSSGEQNDAGSINGKINNTTNDFSWGITRQNYKWTPKLAKTWQYSNSEGLFEKYSFKDISGFYLPESVITYDNVSININDIKNAVPDMKDVVSSPSNDMLAVITSDKIYVFANPKNGITKPALTIKLNGNENIVMDQWAIGKFVSVWDTLIGKYLK